VCDKKTSNDYLLIIIIFLLREDNIFSCKCDLGIWNNISNCIEYGRNIPSQKIDYYFEIHK
jgi:hypothetical protein